MRTTVTTSHPPTSQGSLSQIPKPPLTDILLQTAREVLQLPEEPGDVKAFLHMQEPGGPRLSQMAGPVVTETVISSGHQVAVSTSTHHQQWHHTDLQGEQGINSIPGQRLSLEEENSQQMEVGALSNRNLGERLLCSSFLCFHCFIPWSCARRWH